MAISCPTFKVTGLARLYAQCRLTVGLDVADCMLERVLSYRHRKATNKFLLDSIGELLDCVAYARQIVGRKIDEGAIGSAPSPMNDVVPDFNLFHQVADLGNLNL